MRRTLTTLLLTLCLLTAAVTPAAAQSDDSGGIVSIAISIVTNPVEVAGGLADRASIWASGFGDDPDADRQAERLRSFLATNNASWTDHANAVADEYNLSIGNGTYAYELAVDETSVYVVATANGTDITGYEAVNSTSENIERTINLSPSEAKQLNEDVREYDEEYVQHDEIPPKGYYVGKAATYGGRGVL